MTDDDQTRSGDVHGSPPKRVNLMGGVPLLVYAAAACAVCLGVAVYIGRHDGRVARTISGRNPAAMVHEAYRLLEDDQPKEALELFRRAAEQGVSEAWLGMGVALRRLDRTADSIDALNRALETRPDDPSPYRHLLKAHQEQGDATAEWALLEEMAQRFPDDAFCRLERGVYLCDRGELDAGIGELERALAGRLSPNDLFRARFSLGAACRKAGRLPQAVTALEGALRLRPDHKRAQELLKACRSEVAPATQAR